MFVDHVQRTGVRAGTTSTQPAVSSYSTRWPPLSRTIRPGPSPTKTKCSGLPLGRAREDGGLSRRSKLSAVQPRPRLDARTDSARAGETLAGSASGRSARNTGLDAMDCMPHLPEKELRHVARCRLARSARAAVQLAVVFSPTSKGFLSVVEQRLEPSCCTAKKRRWRITTIPPGHRRSTEETLAADAPSPWNG